MNLVPSQKLINRLTLVTVCVITLFYAVFCSIISLKRFYNFDPTCIDATYPIVWQEAKNHIIKLPSYLESHLIYKDKIDIDGNKNNSYYLFWCPMIYGFIIFYALLPFPELLLILHTLMVSIGAVPIYLLAKKRFDNILLSFAIFISYILNPAINITSIVGFIPFVIVIPIFLFIFYFLEKNMFKVYIFFIFLINMVRLDITIVTLLFGICLVATGKNKRYGKATILVSAAWIVITTIPFLYFTVFARKELFVQTLRLEEYGHNYWEVLQTFLRNPSILIDNFLRKDKFNVFIIFVPLGFISLISPFFLIPIAINLFFTLFIKSETTLVFVFVPFILLTYVYGIEKVINRLSLLTKHNNLFKRLDKGRLILAFSIFIISLGVLSHFFLRQFSIFHKVLFEKKYFATTKHHYIGHKFLNIIPKTASLLGGQPIYLVRHKEVGIFPQNLHSKSWEYILLDLTNYPNEFPSTPFYKLQDTKMKYNFIKPDNYRNELELLLKGDSYGVLTYEDGWLLLKRGYSSARNKEILVSIPKYF